MIQASLNEVGSSGTGIDSVEIIAKLIGKFKFLEVLTSVLSSMILLASLLYEAWSLHLTISSISKFN